MMALIGMADLVVLLVSLHSSSHSSSLADLLLSPPIVRASVYFLAPCVALVVGGTVLMVDREAATTRKRTSFGSASSGGRQSRSTTLDYSNNAYQSLHLILNDSGHLLDSSTLSRPSYTDDDDDEDDDVAAGDRAPLVAAPIEGTAPNVAVPLVVGDDTDDHDDDDKQHAHGKATDRLAADEEEEERDNTWDDWLRVGRVLWTQRSPFAAAFLSSTISGVLQLFSNSWIGATVGIVTDAGPTSRGTLSTHSRAPRHKAKARVSHRCMPLLAAEDRVYELIQSTVLLVSLYIVMATAFGIRNTLFHAITERVSAKLRIDAFSSLLTQPVRVYHAHTSRVGECDVAELLLLLLLLLPGLQVEFFDGTDAGEIWGRLSNDVNEMDTLVTALESIAYAAVLLLGSIVFLFTISWVRSCCLSGTACLAQTYIWEGAHLTYMLLLLVLHS